MKQVLAGEGRSFTDPGTGARIRQVTDHPSIHHHPFYYLPCMDDAMQRLIFVSHRTGRPELWCEARESGALLQLTEHADLAEWSVHPSRDGRYVYFTDSAGAWRVECKTRREECLASFADLAMRSARMVGAAMGTTSLSHDDRFWAVPLKVGEHFCLLIIDTRQGTCETILRAPTIGHPQFHPSDNTLLRYAGPYHSRIWVVNRDGSHNRHVYRRQGTEWIVHETWNPARPREIITANWPHGCIGIHIDSGETRPVCSFNAWHASINQQGTLMVADTTFPDRGLMLFDPRDGAGEPRPLCASDASNIGAHWQTDHCPYDDEAYKQGTWTVYAPQHTHPHPAFTPDGRHVAFTSDRTGYSQIYVATAPE